MLLFYFLGSYCLQKDVENPGKKLPNWGYIAFKKPYDKASHPFESPACKFTVKNEVCQISYCTKIYTYIDIYTYIYTLYLYLHNLDSGFRSTGKRDGLWIYDRP